MRRVLVSPAEFEISTQGYGKTFNLLNSINREDLTIDAHVSHCLDTPDSPSLHIHEFKRANRLGYYSSVFRTAAQELRSGTVDVYHHMNLSFRWFNPLLLTGVQGDIPVVIGPCQTGHEIMAEEFNRMVSHTLGVECPRLITDPFHRGINAVRDFSLDPIRTSLFKRTLSAADRVIVVDNAARNFYENFVPKSKLRVIPLGIHPDDFPFNERQDTTELVAIGSLRRRKGYDVLLDSLSIVADSFPDVQLHVFGDGPMEETLRDQARKLGLENNVTFHGFVPQSEIKNRLTTARAFVHPSRSEGFSFVRLEAMASGCPVVVSDTDGAREKVRDGTDGFVVPKEAPEQLAERIVTLLSDLELAQVMGHSARKRVEEKYDWKQIGRAYAEVYHSLL